MIALVLTLFAIILCCAAIVFAATVMVSSRRPYLIGAAVVSTFIAGICIAATFQTDRQPNVFEMLDALFVCEATTGTRCYIQWQARPHIEDVPSIVEQSEIASTNR